MALYTINYLDGHVENIPANSLEPVGSHYVGYTDGAAVAYIQSDCVRSIVRNADSETERD